MFVNPKLLFAVVAFDALVASAEGANIAYGQVKHVSRGIAATGMMNSSYGFAKRDEVVTVTVTATDCGPVSTPDEDVPETDVETPVETTGFVTEPTSTPVEATEPPVVPSESSQTAIESSSALVTKSFHTGGTSTVVESTTAAETNSVGTTMQPSAPSSEPPVPSNIGRRNAYDSLIAAVGFAAFAVI